jgi:signal transduction histidine kinase
VPGSALAIRIVFGALVYLALGHAGLALSIPTGYASPLFPAAGFAVAFLLWAGWRAWPAIFVGSTLLNLNAGFHDASHVAAALGIAFGATAQALVAVRLIKHRSGTNWRTLESVRDITRVLLLAGPLACLVSASVGVTTLYSAGLAPQGDIAFTWWNWWAGDTLGILIALPLSLTFLLRNEPAWHARQAALGLPMLTTLIVIAVGYTAVSQWEHSRIDTAIAEHGEQLAKRLEQRFIAHQEALAALKRLIEVTPDMNYTQFDHFTRITLRENPDIFGLSYNPYVRQAERAVVERRMAARTQRPDFEIRERDPHKGLVRAGDRPDYVAVGFIAPLQGNLPAIGFDINSEPVRQAAIRKARETRQPSITATIQLVQENQKRVGALLLHPAYETGPDTDTPPSDANLKGFAVGVIKLDEMVQIATAQDRIAGLEFHIDDVTDARPSKVLYSSNAPPAATHSTHLKRRELRMADRTWAMTVFPTAAYQPANRPWVAWATAIVGLLLAALLQVLLLVTTGQRAAAERQMQRQSARLETQDAELQDRTALINALFDLSPDGFVAFAPDGSIRFANPAFYRMTGISANDVWRHTIAGLDRHLRECAEQPERHVSLANLFSDQPQTAAIQKLALARPQKIVLQIGGVRGLAATSIDRFAYFRDVTHEAEVDRMKSEFLSHAAHELRTPMASIFGFTELLMTQEFDEATRKDLLATIYKQTAWLVDIINELLDLARIESRRGKDFSIAAVALDACVADVLGTLSIDAERWPIIVEVADDLPPALADAAKLRQAITNVLGNAVKYSPAGGTLSIRGVTRVSDDRPQVGLIVADHGIGMTPEQVSHVGERFYRADSSGNIPGTGLGMAIVKEILDLLGGSFTVVSTPGTGTTVSLWLPVATPSLPPVALQENRS